MTLGPAFIIQWYQKTIKELCLTFIKTRVSFSVPVPRMNARPLSAIPSAVSYLPLVLVSVSLLLQGFKCTEITFSYITTQSNYIEITF